MDSITTVVRTVGLRWQEQGLNIHPGAPASALREFEARFGVECPHDFATYLLTLGGMDAATWDEHLIRFWPLEEIRPVGDTSDVSRYDGYFVFADYSISAHEYAIRLSIPSRGQVSLIVDDISRLVAPTFTSFLSSYLSDPLSLFRV